MPTGHVGITTNTKEVRYPRVHALLNQLGIGIKTIEPGGMKTDFFTRSFDTGRHPAYDALVNQVMGIITDPKQMATYSFPEQIAEVVYEAATDGKDQPLYCWRRRKSDVCHARTAW